MKFFLHILMGNLKNVPAPQSSFICQSQNHCLFTECFCLHSFLIHVHSIELNLHLMDLQ